MASFIATGLLTCGVALFINRVTVAAPTPARAAIVRRVPVRVRRGVIQGVQAPGERCLAGVREPAQAAGVAQPGQHVDAFEQRLVDRGELGRDRFDLHRIDRGAPHASTLTEGCDRVACAPKNLCDR